VSLLSALIVDDEPLAREGLKLLLAEDKGIARVTEAKHGAEAIRVIRKEAPDLVFLDVQMPEIDGFDVVREVGPQRMPGVIFVTAHDRYAIRAFEINAIDYLLKPVSRERFDEAMRRTWDRRPKVGHAERVLSSLLQTLESPPKYLTRIAIRSSAKTYFVSLADIDWMQAAENYVQLYAGTARHLVHVPMQTLHDSLDPAQFLRIHRSYIVNVSRVKEVESAGRGEYVFVLKGGERLQSSRTYYEHVKRWIDNPW
jgi:two-component system, LytTR family, response regulator